MDVLLLVHPREAREAKGTGRLLALSLARCRREVGEVFEPAVLAAWLSADGRRPLLLYPDVPAAPAAEVVETTALAHAASWRLVVLDATWRKSLGMLLANPALASLPRLALPPASDSEGPYAKLRRAPRPHQRSTLEAVALALGGVERASARYAPLHAALAAFVERALVRQSG